MAGYHIRQIPVGTFGEISKIREELEELEDAHEQGSLLMELQELSDMVGAIEGYLKNLAPNVTLQDLKLMSDITQRAFREGHGKARTSTPTKHSSPGVSVSVPPIQTIPITELDLTGLFTDENIKDLQDSLKNKESYVPRHIVKRK